MELVVVGRGTRVTDQLRATAEHKLARLERLGRPLGRVQLEIITELPRIEGGHHVAVSVVSGRNTFRAEASGREVDAALDDVVQRLERQITSRRGKLRTRFLRATLRRRIATD